MASRFLGLQYPLLKTPRGTLAQKKGIDQIKADILQLLLTNPGERVMLPEFGTPLRTLVFNPNDTILEQEAKQMISESILKWEPRVIIQNIIVSASFNNDDLHVDDPGHDAGHILGIKIEFLDPEQITQIEELTLEIPLG